MEALGVVSSIIAVLQLTTAVVNYLASVKSSSKDQKQCATEATNLLVLLTRLKFRVEEASSSDPWFISVRALDVDNGPLSQYKAATERLVSHITHKGKAGKIGAALSWPLNKAEVADILASIERLKSFISLALELDHFKLSEAIKDETRLIPNVAQNVDVIRRNQDEQQIKEIANWLSSVDFSQQQHNFVAQRREGTGEWFLKSPEFVNWLEGSTATLFCPGRAGAGKTIISSLVIQHLQDFMDPRRHGLAFLFCDYNSQEKQRALDLLLAVLKQLVVGLSTTPEALKALYEKHEKGKSRPHSLEELTKAIEVVAGCYNTVYIVIDALDECSDINRDDLISHLKLLQGLNIKFMATSRRIGTIEEEFEAFENSAILEIVADAEDIKRFVHGELPRLARCVSRDEDLKSLVTSTITEAADGMFILARLQFELLVGEPTARKIKSTLQALPKGSKQLFKAYEKTMTRLENQSPGHTHLARTVLAWIVNAKRPLTVKELQHALATEIGDPDLDQDNVTDMSYILSACVGLIIVETESQVVRLVHYTAYEYLNENWASSISDSQRNMAEICISYLLFETFSSGAYLDDTRYHERLENYTFCDYAAQNWGYHAYAASIQKEEIVMTFLNSQTKVPAAAEMMLVLADYSYSYQSSYVPRNVTGVHLAAHFGLKDTMIALRAAGHYLHPLDSKERTPLFYAVSNGQEEAVRWLLDVTDSDLRPTKARDLYGQTLLCCAAEHGQYLIVKLLLERDDVDVNHLDNEHSTPLSLAARKGHIDVVKLLLSTEGVRPDSGKPPPLSVAARLGRLEIVRLLLQDGRSDIDSRVSYGQTPLVNAAEFGHIEIVKLLLSTPGVEIGSRNEQGDTALARAAKSNQYSIVKLLLTVEGIDPNSKNNEGMTPLSWATADGYLEVVRLLLSDGRVEADIRCTNGRNLLSLASRGQNVEVVRLLLSDPRVGPDSRDSNGRTPLSHAASDLSIEVVRVLLSDHRIDPDSRDSNGRTPLSHAAFDPSIEAVRVLLSDHRIDPDSRDSNGRTPLSHASSGPSTEVFRSCLSHLRLNLESKDAIGRTPLSYAAANRWNVKDFQLLLSDTRTNPNCEDSQGRTPLSHAVERENVSAIKLLLADDRVDPDFRDRSGRSPLLHVAHSRRFFKSSSVELIHLLLTNDRIDPNSQDERGRSIISYAAEANSHDDQCDFKSLLMEKRFNLNLRDARGWTPFHYAAEAENVGTMRLLLSEDDFDIHLEDLNNRSLLSWFSERFYYKMTKEVSEDDDMTYNLKRDREWYPYNDGRRGGALHHYENPQGFLSIVQIIIDKCDNGGAFQAQRRKSSQVNDVENWYAVVVRLLCACNKAPGKLEDSCERIKRVLMDEIVELDFKDASGRNLLWWAARLGDETITRLLLTKGVDVESKDVLGRTPLLSSAMHGHAEVVELLLAAKGIDISAHDSNGFTALSLASWYGHAALVKFLLGQKDLDLISDKSESDLNPMILAVRGGHEAVVRLFLEDSHFNAFSRDSTSWTPLFYAAKNGHDNIVNLLIDKGADPNLEDKNSFTPLFVAAAEGHAEVVRTLLAQDAVDPNPMLLEKAQTALHFAAARGDDKVAGVLLGAKGIKEDPVDGFGQTPLWLAASEGHEGVVKLLLATKNVNVKAVSKTGLTPLSAASENRRPGVVKMLLGYKESGLAIR
ncbi:hypothetical protein ACHAPJ_009998 [Fusarium lateritium]